MLDRRVTLYAYRPVTVTCLLLRSSLAPGSVESGCPQNMDAEIGKPSFGRVGLIHWPPWPAGVHAWRGCAEAEGADVLRLDRGLHIDGNYGQARRSGKLRGRISPARLLTAKRLSLRVD
jgi:hypothetical protein